MRLSTGSFPLRAHCHGRALDVHGGQEENQAASLHLRANFGTGFPPPRRHQGRRARHHPALVFPQSPARPWAHGWHLRIRNNRNNAALVLRKKKEEGGERCECCPTEARRKPRAAAAPPQPGRGRRAGASSLPSPSPPLRPYKRGGRLRAGPPDRLVPAGRAALPASLRRGPAWCAAAAPRPGGSMAFIRKRRQERELYSKER